jgi:hypothetical protein
MTKVFLTTTGTPTWTKDSTWNDSDNKVEVLGAGSGGTNATPGKIPCSGRGGGGGAYTYLDDVNLSSFPTTVPYQISAGGPVGASSPVSTWFATSSTVLATSGSTPAPSAPVGGAAASCIPSANAFSGGGGPLTCAGAGGGGAAGGAGAGAAGVNAGPGGTGNNGGTPANTAGTNFQVSPAFGSGGGGNIDNVGGLYGGGGGRGRAGAQGLIVLTWTPAAGKVWTQVHIYKGIENADTE